MTKPTLLLLACLLLTGCQTTPEQPQTDAPEPVQPQSPDRTPIQTHPEEPEPFGRQTDRTEPCSVGPWVMDAPAGRNSKTRDWVVYRHRADGLDAADFPARLEEAERQYGLRPDDVNRMRLAYLLSRPDPTLQQLKRAREVLSGISNSSELAPFRDPLDREIGLLMQLKQDKGRMDELQAQLDALEAQLAALKAIEEEMVENRENMEEDQP